MNNIGNQVKEKAFTIKSVTDKAAQSMNNLTQSSMFIKGSMDEMAAGARQINQAAGNVSSLAISTNENIKEINDQIGKFTI